MTLEKETAAQIKEDNMADNQRSRRKSFQQVFTLILLVVILIIIYVMNNQSKLYQRDLAAQRRPKGSRMLLTSDRHRKPEVKLTMFTTFSDKKYKYRTYCNTLHNWALFLPQIQPILFTYETDERLINLAKTLGWLVVDVPRLSNTKVPFLKEMYFAAEKHSKSVFYSFFNGDLLFNDSFVDTVLTVEKYLDQLNRPLIVGRRTNVNLRERELWKKDDVTEAAREGHLWITSAMDYFILAGNQFVWDVFEDVIIGRPGYDNYIVALALNHNLSVIDATETIFALHQTGKDGNQAGFDHRDTMFNLNLLSHFNRSRGHVTFAQYTTQRNCIGAIELWHRF